MCSKLRSRLWISEATRIVVVNIEGNQNKKWDYLMHSNGATYTIKIRQCLCYIGYRYVAEYWETLWKFPIHPQGKIWVIEGGRRGSEEGARKEGETPREAGKEGERERGRRRSEGGRREGGRPRGRAGGEGKEREEGRERRNEGGRSEREKERERSVLRVG